MSCRVYGLIAEQWEPMALVNDHLEVAKNQTVFDDESAAAKAIADSVDYYTKRNLDKRLTYSIMNDE